MDRQQSLDNFIAATKGKGQCLDDTSHCRYTHEAHPGCAIGCQPGFREIFGEMKWVSDNITIEAVLDGTEGQEIQTAVEEFFDIDHGPDWVDGYEDVDFLVALQNLHDGSGWEDGKIYHTDLVDFCEYWDLKIPQKSS